MDSANRTRVPYKQNTHLIVSGSQLCRSIPDEELDCLENEIRKAYMLKSLQSQLIEHQANKISADIQKRITDKVIQFHANVKDEKFGHLQKCKQFERTSKLKAELEQQIAEKYIQRSLIAAKECKERLILMTVDRLSEEREKQECKDQKVRFTEQMYIESFLQRELLKLDSYKLKELEAREAQKNENYIKEMDQRAEQLVKLREKALEKREESIKAVAKTLLELDKEKKERQQLLINLLVEEVKFDSEIVAREIQLHRYHKMRKLAEDLQEQINFENNCRKRFLEREMEFTKAVMVKVMESERMEQMTVEIRRRKCFEFRQELQHLMKERECARVLELDRLRYILKEENRIDQVNKEEVKKARIVLLKKHVNSVRDFLNQKLLHDEEREIVKKANQNK